MTAFQEFHRPGYAFLAVLAVALASARPVALGQEEKGSQPEGAGEPAALTGRDEPETPRAGGKAEPSEKASKPRPGLDSYCPASYLLHGKATKGDPKYPLWFRGRLYHFSSNEARTKFQADPEKFFPQFDGLCTTALGGSYGNRIESDPEVFDVREEKVYLFSSLRAKNAYDTMPPWFLRRAEQRFAEPALDGYCPVAYQERGKAMAGRPALQTVFGGWVYRFLNEQFKESFLQTPAKYVPQFDGVCAEGLANGRRYAADPSVFIVHKGKTYLFHDPKVKLLFLRNRDAYIEKADEHWAEGADD